MPLALITGASSGFGHDLALTAARHGYDLILVARSNDKLEALAVEARQQGVQAQVITADLNVPEAPAKVAKQALAAGPIDILINSAGFGDYGAFVDRPWEVVASLIQVNIVATTELTRRIVPHMIERKRGRIMNIASTGAFQPAPYFGVYSASKAYVLSFSEAIHEELRGTGVTVTAVCPGPTETGFHAVANTGTGLVNRWFTMESEPVVEAAWDGMMDGKAVVVPGWFNALNAVFIGYFPRSWARKMAEFAMRPR